MPVTEFCTWKLSYIYHIYEERGVYDSRDYIMLGGREGERVSRPEIPIQCGRIDTMKPYILDEIALRLYLSSDEVWLAA